MSKVKLPVSTKFDAACIADIELPTLRAEILHEVMSSLTLAVTQTPIGSGLLHVNINAEIITDAVVSRLVKLAVK